MIAQLKKEFPNWKRLPKNLKEIVGEYDFKQVITAPAEELLDIDNQISGDGIIKLDEMGQFIDRITSDRIIKFSNYDRSAIYIKDEELQFIDQLIDDKVINALLAYDSYSPSMRENFLNHQFRAELLKNIKYPEISYRKFCTEEYLGLAKLSAASELIS